MTNSQNHQMHEASFSYKLGAYILAALGALGTALQNVWAVLDAIANLKLYSLIKQILAITLGGVCSGLINLCLNIKLLAEFIDRLLNKQSPKLEGFWLNLQYWGGCLLFIISGILFGLTAFTFSGPLGAASIISVLAGLLVALIMMIQELETWLKSFDPNQNTQKNYSEKINWAWALGMIIALGNVLALSLLFTAGWTSFMMSCGVALLPALISGFCIAFTFGAFTEFYFYNFFLSDFCQNIQEKFQKLAAIKNTSLNSIGISCALLNAGVNAALCYSGILFLLNPLLMSAGLSPIPVLLAIIAGIFGGLASLSLGIDFWIDNHQIFLGDFDSVFNFNKGDDNLSLAIPLPSNKLATAEAGLSILAQSSKKSSEPTPLCAAQTKTVQ